MTNDKQTNKIQESVNLVLTVVVMILLVIMPPISCCLLYLSRVPDLTWERNDGLTTDRIWMYREGRPLGLAYQSQRVVAEYDESEVCVETRLRFLLWSKSRLVKPANSSQRMRFDGARWQPTGQECR